MTPGLPVFVACVLARTISLFATGLPLPPHSVFSAEVVPRVLPHAVRHSRATRAAAVHPLHLRETTFDPFYLKCNGYI